MKISRIVWLCTVLVLPGESFCAESNLPPFRVSLNEAVMLALEHNPAFRVQRLQPQIVQTREGVARASCANDRIMRII